MERYTLIFVADERSPVRRFQLPKVYVQRALYGAVVVALLVCLATWDYWRKRADNAELAGLRIESAEQREQIETFKTTLADLNGELARVRELERKVRIIANLPGAAAVGGAEVTDLVSPQAVGGQGVAPSVPAGVPVPLEGGLGQGAHNSLDVPLSDISDEDAVLMGLTTNGARYVRGLGRLADGMSRVAESRADSLDLLIDQLDSKRVKLSSMPSVWPAKGWLTSRFGARVSPFTGRSQHHSGIDIAARRGTNIIAPAHGRVHFVGRKGPLGNTLVLDHGFGVRTFYGHTDEIHVKPGEEVERGQLIAAIGSTGRSTGPHLHYVVEVKGKSRNPLDYIFD
jgi:murein DD-endopeptidase MepM/ murein hydrolase activator NlpD